MNAETGLRRAPLSAVVAIACIGVAAVVPLAAFADPPSAPNSQTLESTVSLADLDLSTPDGVRAAQKRLKGKAECLCRQLWDSVSTTFRWTYAACVQETLANAIRQLNVPAVAALDRAGAKP